MQYQNTAPHAAAFTGPADWLAWILSTPGRLSSTMRRNREIRQARAALCALDDWTLRDIGISRHEIVAGQRWR
jgi:uncharacterized protein YjiS (DUF1127 family)